MRSAAAAPMTIAPSWKSPHTIVNPAIAITSATAPVYWLTGREKSTRLSTQILMPMMPMRPYRAVVTPPSTPAGIELNTAPTTGESDSRIAKTPATQYAAVEYTRVAAMTPMFSPYVVVPEPPKVPASTVAAPSAMSARPVYWFTDDSVMVATPRTCPTFSAMSTSTTGRNIAMTLHVPGLPNVGNAKVGRPIHWPSSTSLFTAAKSTSPAMSAAM